MGNASPVSEHLGSLEAHNTFDLMGSQLESSFSQGESDFEFYPYLIYQHQRLGSLDLKHPSLQDCENTFMWFISHLVCGIFVIAAGLSSVFIKLYYL